MPPRGATVISLSALSLFNKRIRLLINKPDEGLHFIQDGLNV
jgi:hypothetical protein